MAASVMHKRMLDSDNSVFEGTINNLLRNELITEEQDWIDHSTLLSYWVKGDKDGKKLDRLVTIGNHVLKEKGTDSSMKTIMAKNLGKALEARSEKREGHALTSADKHAQELMDKLNPVEKPKKSLKAGELPGTKSINTDVFDDIRNAGSTDLGSIKLDVNDSKTTAQ